MVWPWMCCLWIITLKNPAERKKQVRWALIYSLFCAQTIPEKHGALMKWGKSHFARFDAEISSLSNLEKS